MDNDELDPDLIPDPEDAQIKIVTSNIFFIPLGIRTNK